MVAPTETHMQDLVFPDGQDLEFYELKVPARGTIGKLVVAQTEGTDDGFSVDVFNSAVLRERWQAERDAGSAVPDNGSHEAIYRVTPTLTATANESVVSFFNDSEQAYVNMDSKGTSNMRRSLYLRITPGAQGEKKFDVAIMTFGVDH